MSDRDTITCASVWICPECEMARINTTSVFRHFQLLVENLQVHQNSPVVESVEAPIPESLERRRLSLSLLKVRSCKSK